MWAERLWLRRVLVRVWRDLADRRARRQPLGGPMTAKPPETPQEALDLLYAGNQRFVSGEPRDSRRDMERVREVSSSQRPFAAFLGCADSRVPIEIIFNQGFGDLFVTRIAGSKGHLCAGSHAVRSGNGCGAAGRGSRADQRSVPAHAASREGGRWRRGSGDQIQRAAPGCDSGGIVPSDFAKDSARRAEGRGWNLRFDVWKSDAG